MRYGYFDDAAREYVIDRVDVAGGEMVFKADVLREVGLFAD